MHIEEIIQKIVPADRGCMKLAQTRFDNLIKPVGSLAKLEEMTSRYCGIKGIYEKEDLDYPKRDLLVWCGIEEAAQAEKIMHAQWPVNVLAAETGAKAVALLVTSEEEADALEEGAALVQELVHEKGLELLGFGCLSNPDNGRARHDLGRRSAAGCSNEGAGNAGRRCCLQGCQKGSGYGTGSSRLLLCRSCFRRAGSGRMPAGAGAYGTAALEHSRWRR